MTFAETGIGETTVTYTVDVHLLGAAKLGELLVPAVLKRVAGDGEDGMRERLLRL